MGDVLFKMNRDIAEVFIENEVAIHNDFSDGLRQAQYELELEELDKLADEMKDYDLER